MRDIEKIMEEQAAARREYHENPSPELNKKVRDLMAEASSTVTNGASNCFCGNPPHGMLRNADKNIYEIGCLHSGLHEDNKAPRAQGRSAEKAVANWNAGNFINAPK